VEDFALLIPVPVVLHAEDVHVLDRSVFDSLEGLTGPTLSELQERDPCFDPDEDGAGAAPTGGIPGGVTVQSEFVVGEYQVVVLSATESTALQAWLDAHEYKVPPTLGDQLRGYVASGSSFFVAKVDPTKVTFVDGRAVLSPLRFDYDSTELSLPIRLSAASSPGVQELLVHVISPSRYEAANRPNRTIPTDLDLTDAAATDFPACYATLFDRVLAATPGAVVTEYASPAPIPDTVLFALGASSLPINPVVSRLHLRVSKDEPLDDLVLKEAAPLNHGFFMASYFHKRPFVGKVTCDKPRWGHYQGGHGAPAGAPFTAKAGAASLEALVASDVPELGVVARDKPAPRAAPSKGCGCHAADPGGALLLMLLVAVRLRSRA
jgi:hypothetical protein